MSEIELTDQILRHSLEILRLSAGEQARADAMMAELIAELRMLLLSRDVSAATKRDIEAIIAEADRAIAAKYAELATSVDTHELALIVAEKTAHLVEGVGATMPTAARLASLTKDVLIDGAPSSAWWSKQAEDTAFKFAAQVRQGVINNETQAQIVQRIVGKNGEPGIMDVARRNARALVHSSVMNAANQARLASFRAMSAHIAGVRWLATLDGHTCPRCAALDGQGWTLDGEKLPGTEVTFQAPPIHWNDRCVLSPIPKGLDEIFPGMDAKIAAASMRASKDGPIAAKVTFNDFLHRQSPAFIDKMLGKGRADLFNAGKITVRDLVSGTGRELTLDELR
jgi:SPP1 gp7 family putative phage head morphogenesis protein